MSEKIFEYIKPQFEVLAKGEANLQGFDIHIHPYDEENELWRYVITKKDVVDEGIYTKKAFIRNYKKYEHLMGNILLSDEIATLCIRSEFYTRCDIFFPILELKDAQDKVEEMLDEMREDND